MTITGFYYPVLQCWKMFAFIRSVMSAWREPAGTDIPVFRSEVHLPYYIQRFSSNGALQWGLYSKTQYTFIPLRSIKRDACTRRTLQLSQTPEPLEKWDVHLYTYETLPHLECHLAPSFAAINGGPKCAGIDLDAITLDYCQSVDSRPALKRRLELLCKIWKLFQDYSIKPAHHKVTVTTVVPTGNNIKRKHISGSHKRKAAPSLCGKMLTERAVFLLSKQQKTCDFCTMVKHWAESIHD
jgi:hypothetical protein